MIRKTVITLALGWLMLGISSCKKGNQELENPNSEIQFGATVTSQGQAGSGVANAFETDDQIGVFMFASGQSLLQSLATNRRYVLASSGTFRAQGQGDRIFFPGQGRVDFVAYHPYQDGVTSTYQVNVADQSDLRAIDLLRGNVTDVDGSAVGEVPRLSFRHELSKVVFEITGDGIALTGLAVRFNSINSRAAFDLANAQITGNNTPINISARVSADGTRAEAILLPGEMGGQTITFTVGNRSFTTTMPSGLTYMPGTRYTYNVVLQGDGQGLTEVELQQGQIMEWIDVVGDSITLSPDGEAPPQPGVEMLLYEENFATTPTITTALIGNYRGYTAAGFADGTITYSNVGEDVGFGDIRSTATISPSLWLPANRQVTFQASGLDAANANNMRLTFDIAAANAALGNTQNANNDIITVNFNGIRYTLPPITFISNNGFIPVSIPLSTVGTINSVLQLVSVSDGVANTGNTIGIRIDNIRLYGIR